MMNAMNTVEFYCPKCKSSEEIDILSLGVEMLDKKRENAEKE